MSVEAWKHVAAVSGIFLFTYGLVASMSVPAVFIMVVRNGYGWNFFAQSAQDILISSISGIIALVFGLLFMWWGLMPSTKAIEPKVAVQ